MGMQHGGANDSKHPSIPSTSSLLCEDRCMLGLSILLGMLYMGSVSMAFVYIVLSFALASLGAAQTSSCSTTLTPTNSVKPTVASGYRMALVATGLTKPRSIQFDTAGNLLVVQSGVGIANLAFQDNGGTCLTIKKVKTVISASAVSITLRETVKAKLVCSRLTGQRFNRLPIYPVPAWYIDKRHELTS